MSRKEGLIQQISGPVFWMKGVLVTGYDLTVLAETSEEEEGGGGRGGEIALNIFK
jgi:hypothetical protein